MTSCSGHSNTGREEAASIKPWYGRLGGLTWLEGGRVPKGLGKWPEYTQRQFTPVELSELMLVAEGMFTCQAQERGRRNDGKRWDDEVYDVRVVGGAQKIEEVEEEDEEGTVEVGAAKAKRPVHRLRLISSVIGLGANRFGEEFGALEQQCAMQPKWRTQGHGHAHLTGFIQLAQITHSLSHKLQWTGHREKQIITVRICDRRYFVWIWPLTGRGSRLAECGNSVSVTQNSHAKIPQGHNQRCTSWPM